MSDINRGLDHMTYQLRAWSPGQAMLPPDPGGHNRALDRVAAEHLREVAPGLAPAAPAPTAEAKGMSREEFAKHGSAMLLLVLQDARPRYDEFVRHFNAIAECDAALRARARASESEERELTECRKQLLEVIGELQCALQMSTAPGAPNIVEAMKWETDHHRHETGRRSKLVADLATERAARVAAEAERDGTLTEANDLRLRVERLVEGAAKLTERAEEAEEELRLADFRVKSAESRSDDFAARLAAAEAEVKRLTALSPPHTVALRLDEINAAFDGPIPTAWPKDVTGSVVSRIAALRERAERLEADKASLLERWATGNGEVPK